MFRLIVKIVFLALFMEKRAGHKKSENMTEDGCIKKGHRCREQGGLEKAVITAHRIRRRIGCMRKRGKKK